MDVISDYLCRKQSVTMWQKIPPLLRNKYVITGLAFLLWLTFFDRNNFISQVNLGRTLTEQRQQRSFYLKEIKRDSTGLHELMSDTTLLEKFAREKYLMKKDNEDIYLIIRDKE